MKATFGLMVELSPLTSSRPRVILSRTDRLGDLLLTLPMANFLSKARPEVEVVFLVRRYTAPLLAHHDPPYPAWVLEENPSFPAAEAIVHVYPRPRLAWQAWRARIPLRIGTSRRWYHWLFCNVRPHLARRYSFLHESVLNLRLLLALLPTSWQEKVLRMSVEDIFPYRARLRSLTPLPEAIQKRLDAYPLRIGLHVGGKGGAPLWPPSSWKALGEILHRRYPEALFVFTGSPEEKPLIDFVANSLPPLQVLRTDGMLSLSQLITLISRLNVFMSGTTGPLHIAAALDVPAITVYPATAAMGPWRWRPLSPYVHLFTREGVCKRCTTPRPCLCLAGIEPLRLADALPNVLRLKSAQLS